MTYTLKDIKHLEVMANLLNAEPAAPQKIDIKSLLASDEKKEPTMGEKILSLCAKLRNEGFELQASSLEHKFLNYKVANTHLYKAIDEDGEDLIDAAHPDGEVKVEDADGDLGVVETIVTEHEKLVDKVNKEPNGKLANYVEKARAVFAQQATNDLDALYASALAKLNLFITKFGQVLKSLDIQDSRHIDYLNQAKNLIEKKQVNSLDGEFFNLNRYIDELTDEEGPSWYSTLVTKNKWNNEIAPMLDTIKDQLATPFNNDIKNIIEIQNKQKRDNAVKQVDINKPAENPMATVDPVKSRIDACKSKVKSFKSQLNADLKFMNLNDAAKAQVNQWLDTKNAFCDTLKTAYDDHLAAYKNVAEKIAPARIISNLESLEQQLNAFYEKWIK